MRHTENLEAYDRYLRALNCPPSDAGVDRLRKHLEEAVALDPGFARARALLANAYMLAHQVGRDWGMDLIANARDQAQRALELNPSDGVAHYVMAHYYLFAGESERLAEETRRAIELSPNSASMLADLGRILAFGTGRTEEGMEMARRAMRLNPRYPDWYRWAPAFHYTMRGDHEQGADAFELIQEPALWRNFYLAINYTRLGQEAKAKGALESALRINSDLTVAWSITRLPYHASLIDRIVDGAIAAGFPPGDIESLRTSAQ